MYRLTLSLSDGTYSWFVKARSRYGLNSSAERVLVVDTEALRISVSPRGINGSILREPAVIEVGIEEPNVRRMEVSLEGKPLFSTRKAGTLRIALDPRELGDGRHVVRVEVEDLAGNIGASTLVFTVDTAPPVVEVLGPGGPTTA